MDQAMTFPRYESYKNSDTDWLGDIPSDWSLGTIRAVTQLKSEKNQPELQVLSVYREYGVIPKDSLDDNHNATSLDTSGYKVVNKGDLVVNKMKAWQGSMGVSEHDGIVSPAYITCCVDAERVYPRFLHYLLRSQPYIGVYNALSYGVRVGQWDMHYEDFKCIPLPLPDRTCQQRIANFLNQKTTEIDEAIAKKQRLIELLKEQKAILINRAVTKGLNPDVPMRDSGVEWIGEVPSHWKVKKIKYCTKIFRGKFTHRPRNDHSLYDGAYPFIQTGDVARSGKYLLDYTQTLNEKGLRVSTLFPQGTVIITIAANIGDISILGIDACFPDSIVGFKPCSEVERDYLYYTLSAMKDQFISSTIKNTQMNLNVDRIGSNFIGLPSKTEQLMIVKEIEFNFSQIEQAVESLKNNIFALDDYKRIVISEAVTGKIKI